MLPQWVLMSPGKESTFVRRRRRCLGAPLRITFCGVRTDVWRAWDAHLRLVPVSDGPQVPSTSRCSHTRSSCDGIAFEGVSRSLSHTASCSLHGQSQDECSAARIGRYDLCSPLRFALITRSDSRRGRLAARCRRTIRGVHCTFGSRTRYESTSGNTRRTGERVIASGTFITGSVSRLPAAVGRQYRYRASTSAIDFSLDAYVACS
jgi:hypothetical protein